MLWSTMMDLHFTLGPLLDILALQLDIAQRTGTVVQLLFVHNRCLIVSSSSNKQEETHPLSCQTEMP